MLMKNRDGGSIHWTNSVLTFDGDSPTGSYFMNL
jgi:hypothetical protein